MYYSVTQRILKEILEEPVIKQAGVLESLANPGTVETAASYIKSLAGSKRRSDTFNFANSNASDATGKYKRLSKSYHRILTRELNKSGRLNAKHGDIYINSKGYSRVKN